MKMLVIGRGKTGSLAAEVAAEGGHEVRSVGRADNLAGAAITSDFDVAIDFTTPESALENIKHCSAKRLPLVVGTTGWHAHLHEVEQQVKDADSVLVWGGNFSVGVNLVFEMLRVAAAAPHHGYTASITETHHIHKLDAPSGTALAMQRILGDAAIRSVREGDNMGRHEVTFQSDVDTITLTHQAFSRRGFALGAVKAAEWAATVRHPGIYEFSQIFRQLA